MDILYFQGVRPFRLGGNHHGHPLLPRGSKCCTCHAKRAGGVPNAAPATQTEAAPNVINRCPTSADPYEGAPSAVPATQNEPEVLKLPSYMELEDVKTTLSCEASLKSKTSLCHQDVLGAQTTTCATLTLCDLRGTLSTFGHLRP